MNNLLLYGWNNRLFQLKQSSNFNQLPHGRVTVVHKTCYEVISEEGTFLCELTGNMLYGRSSEEYPCTGDWVLIQPVDKGRGIIFDRLPRDKTLYRRKSGTTSERQAIASHIDKAFIVQSLDMDINIRRMERFILQLTDENILPVLILTKADLGFDEDEIDGKLKHLKSKMPVFLTSIYSDEGVEKLRRYILPGETVVFTGLSGVGKSSLINALCGEDILQTSTISEATRKGRHTSTRREMVLLDNSGVLIDTPGIKLFGVTADNTDALTEMFDISDLEKSCRYADCTHTNEPGCAVMDAVEAGILDRGVYNNYHKLKKEAAYFATAGREKREKEKSLSKRIKEWKNNKRDL